MRSRLKAHPRLRDRFPTIRQITLQWSSRHGTTELAAKTWVFKPHVRALMELDCPRRGCLDGGHDLERLVRDACTQGRSEVSGVDVCDGWRSGTDSFRLERCGCTLHYSIAIIYDDAN